MFPLRSLEFSDGRGRGGLRSKQRTCLYNDAVWSLNWLSGTAAWGLPPSRHAERKGQAVAARFRLVVTAPTSVGAPALEVALKELLRGRGVYEVGPAGVDLAPYRSNLVSLPPNLEGSPNLAGLLPPEVPIFLEGEHELMRRTREETRALVEDGGTIKPYMDSALRHNKKRYLTFLRHLRSRGMLKFVERAKARAGFFLSGSLPRPSYNSSSTLDPERCSSKFLLRSSCVLLRLFQESRLNGTTSGLLMKNRFLLAFQGSAGAGSGRCVGLPPTHEDSLQFGARFCLPQVTAGEMDVVGIGPYDLIFPCPATLPRSFSWSVYLSMCGRSSVQTCYTPREVSTDE